MEEYSTATLAANDNIRRRMRVACWITTATDTHSEYVILIALPRQKLLRERASMLRYSTLPVLFSLLANISRVCFLSEFKQL